MAAFGLAMGAPLLAASALGGQPVIGLGMFAVMALSSAIVLVFGGRNETVGVLGGRPFVVVRRRGPGTSIRGAVAVGLPNREARS
jgi:hypothetical protein